MKTTTVRICSTQVPIEVPDSIDELAALTTGTDKATEEGRANVLNAASQYYLQNHLIKVRSAAVSAVCEDTEARPIVKMGAKMVEPVVEDGKLVAYKGKDGKKYKASAKVTVESDTAFLKRVVDENVISEVELGEILAEAAKSTKFDAEKKRERGSVKSKPVGKKWITLAEKIQAAGNLASAAEKLNLVGFDAESPDAIKRVALAMADEARRKRAAEEKELADMAEGGDK